MKQNERSKWMLTLARKTKTKKQLCCHDVLLRWQQSVTDLHLTQNCAALFFRCIQGYWLLFIHLKHGVESSPDAVVRLTQTVLQTCSAVIGVIVCVWRHELRMSVACAGSQEVWGAAVIHKGTKMEARGAVRTAHSGKTGGAPCEQTPLLTHYNLHKKTYIITKAFFICRGHWVIRGQRSFCNVRLTGQ